MPKIQYIKNENDIISLMSAYNYFHDSCIVSANYISGSFVSENKSMAFGENTLEMVFNSQCSNYTLRFYFKNVLKFNLIPISDAILGCTLKIQDNNILWADTDNFYENSSFIIAKELGFILE